MGNSQSSLSLFRFFRANKDRDQVIDATLGVVQTSLQSLGAVADLLPVAGVGVAVTILQAMVQQIQVISRCMMLLCTLADADSEHAYE